MPHAGLMNEADLGPVRGPLQRARLHLRGGRRRFAQGKISAGIATLYDALEGAMLAFIGDPEKRALLDIRPGDDLNQEQGLYAVLVRSGVLDGRFDFSAFERLTEQALHEDMPDYDYRGLLGDIESLMTRLHVLPFDEASLPPEDPETF